MAYGLALTSIGAGLFSTMTDMTSTGKWVGYQMIAGSGMGALYMLSFIASQVCESLCTLYRLNSTLVHSEKLIIFLEIQWPNQKIDLKLQH